MSLLAAAVATLILGHEEQKKLQLGVVVSRSILVAGAILGFIGIITFLTLIGATPA